MNRIVDDGGFIYAPIQPLQVNFDQATQATKLVCNSTADNFWTTSTVAYTLLDENNAVMGGGQETMTQEEYDQWHGDNDYPYSFIASRKTGIILIN